MWIWTTNAVLNKDLNVQRRRGEDRSRYNMMSHTPDLSTHLVRRLYFASIFFYVQHTPNLPFITRNRPTRTFLSWSTEPCPWPRYWCAGQEGGVRIWNFAVPEHRRIVRRVCPILWRPSAVPQAGHTDHLQLSRHEVRLIGRCHTPSLCAVTDCELPHASWQCW